MWHPNSAPWRQAPARRFGSNSGRPARGHWAHVSDPLLRLTCPPPLPNSIVPQSIRRSCQSCLSGGAIPQPTDFVRQDPGSIGRSPVRLRGFFTLGRHRCVGPHGISWCGCKQPQEAQYHLGGLSCTPCRWAQAPNQRVLRGVDTWTDTGGEPWVAERGPQPETCWDSAPDRERRQLFLGRPEASFASGVATWLALVSRISVSFARVSAQSCWVCASSTTVFGARHIPCVKPMGRLGGPSQTKLVDVVGSASANAHAEP